VFDQRFAAPREARRDRFVWDWWHVPGQYTALRTPAWEYFPKASYERFHRQLVAFGRRTLGCHDISPPWLSCYVEGCEQRLHGDLPHGPWAFVFSLTRWNSRVFRGGETLVVRDQVLDFWSDFTSVRSVEEPEVIYPVEARFNRLVVFDPRVPHGVREVTGTRDPREGRLVIHGWFVRPMPVIEGPLPDAQLRRRVDDLSAAIAPWLDARMEISGLLSIGFRVTPRGRITQVEVLSDTTRVPRAQEARRKRFITAVCATLCDMDFAVQRGPSHVTLPLTFERSA
jgi:hypothetical protein